MKLFILFIVFIILILLMALYGKKVITGGNAKLCANGCGRYIATTFFPHINTTTCCPTCPNHTQNCNNNKSKIKLTMDLFDTSAGRKSVGLVNNTRLTSILEKINNCVLNRYSGSNSPYPVGNSKFHIELVNTDQEIPNKMNVLNSIKDTIIDLSDYSKWVLMGRAFVYKIKTLSNGKDLHITIAFDKNGRFNKSDIYNSCVKNSLI